MNVGVLVSGSGTNLQALLDRARRGELGPARIAVVGSNVPDCAALARARAAGLPTFVVDHRDYSARAGFDRLTLDARRFQPLGSGRHVLAARLLTSQSFAGAGGHVPFYLQDTLGGSFMMRSYPNFRFRGDKVIHEPLARSGVIVAALPVVVPYARHQRETGFARSVEFSEQFSVSWRAFLSSRSYAHSAMTTAVDGWGEEPCFPGFVALAFGFWLAPPAAVLFGALGGGAAPAAVAAAVLGAVFWCLICFGMRIPPAWSLVRGYLSF